MSFQCGPPTPHPVETLAFTPWELAIEPFQVSPRTYYVAGQTWVGCWLIDTGDGCILIDTAIPETSYLLIDSIYKLGYKPTDIKKILLSHAHFDHCGAAMEMKKLTGAEVYMSKEDWDFYQACPEETLKLDKDSHWQEFVVDHFYSDEEPVTLGDISVKTMLNPGHTAGVTSFFWTEVNPVDGKEYTLAMHGGVGDMTMRDSYYATSKYLEPWMRDRFLSDCEILKNIPVDIALPSHPNQILITDRAGQYSNLNMVFNDDTIWHDFIVQRAQQVRDRMHQ